MENEINPMQVTGEDQQPSINDASQSPGSTRETQATIPNAPNEIDGMPAIKSWKTSVPFSILGYVASFLVLWMGLVILFALAIMARLGDAASLFTASEYGQLAGYPAAIVTSILTIVYALTFYRSFYTDSPRLKSSKAISFCNLMFGGIIFGCLWNSNLTKSRLLSRKEMGTSYIVAAVLSAIYICLAGYNVIASEMPLLDQAESYYNQTAGQIASTPAPSQSGLSGGAKSSGPRQVAVPSTSTQITIPEGWGYQVYDQTSESSSAMLMLYPPYVENDTAAFVIAWDMSGYLTEEYMEQYGDQLSIRTVNKEVVLERNRLNMDTVEDETAELVEMSGIDYWKAQTKGSYSGSPMTDTSYYCYRDRIMYQYTMSSLDESEQTNKALAADFKAIVDSADYK